MHLLLIDKPDFLKAVFQAVFLIDMAVQAIFLLSVVASFCLMRLTIIA